MKTKLFILNITTLGFSTHISKISSLPIHALTLTFKMHHQLKN